MAPKRRAIAKAKDAADSLLWRVLVFFTSSLIGADDVPAVVSASEAEGVASSSDIVPLLLSVKPLSADSIDKVSIDAPASLAWKAGDSSKEARARELETSLASVLGAKFKKHSREDAIPRLILQEDVLPVGNVTVLGNLLPESRAYQLPEDLCRELKIDIVHEVCYLMLVGGLRCACRWLGTNRNGPAPVSYELGNADRARLCFAARATACDRTCAHVPD